MSLRRDFGKAVFRLDVPRASDLAVLPWHTSVHSIAYVEVRRSAESANSKRSSGTPVQHSVGIHHANGQRVCGTAPDREGLANETAKQHVLEESPPEDLK